MASIFSLSSICAHALKVGVVDFQQIVEKSTAAQKMNKDIEKEFKPKQEEIVSKQNKLQDKTQELKKNQTILKDTQIEKLQEEILELRRTVERMGEDFQRDLQTAQAKASKQFTDMVQIEIDKLGKKGNYDLILQKPATSYFDSKLDITDPLLRALK
jgi:outer membrane protein